MNTIALLRVTHSIPSHRYPDDPELPFDTLPVHIFQMPDLYEDAERAAEYNQIAAMEQSKNAAESLKIYSEMAYTFLKDSKEASCTAIPEYSCVPLTVVAGAGGGGCIWTPGKASCE